MKNLLNIEDLTAIEIDELLTLAKTFDDAENKSNLNVKKLVGRTLVFAFFEDSTRTRASFDLAAKRLGAQALNFSPGSSSTNKGESIRDTIETVSALGADCFIVRHSSAGVPHQISQWTDSPVINAGDGTHQHPTQALLDCYTLKQKFGSLEGKRIAICGDIDQRVARSAILAFSKLGADVIISGPETMMPAHIETWPVKVEPQIDLLLADIDVLYMLRIQKERKGRQLIPSLREYRSRYGLTAERAKKLKPSAVIMHAGPMNRGVEIDPEVVEDKRSLVLNQVHSGVATRMAVMFKLLGDESDIKKYLEEGAR